MIGELKLAAETVVELVELALQIPMADVVAELMIFIATNQLDLFHPPMPSLCMSRGC
jgi:hypothetical protein